MKLYVVNGSPNSRKVMATLNHLGLAAERIYLDFFAGEIKSPPYLALNPTGRVPVLDDGGFVVWETNAINKYLCSKRPGNTLYPADPRVQADIDRWLSWELAHFNQQLGILSFQTVAMPQFLGQQPNQPVVEWSARHLGRHAEHLERHLEGRRYMVGDDITLADYAVIHIEFFKDMMPFDWSPYPNVNAYFDRMRAAPHWAKTACRPEQIGRVPEGVRAFAA